MNIEEKKADKEAESFCVLQCLAISQAQVNKTIFLIRVTTSAERYCNGDKYNFFPKQKGVTTCNIVVTLYWL